MNVEHIKDAIGRLRLHLATVTEGARCPCTGCEIERRYLLDRVPDLVKENARLRNTLSLVSRELSASTDHRSPMLRTAIDLAMSWEAPSSAVKTSNGGPAAPDLDAELAPGTGSGVHRYYIVSLSRSRQAHAAATFWGPDARGYTIDVDKAGRFTDREVAKYGSPDAITIECGAVLVVTTNNMLNTRHLDSLTSGAVIVNGSAS